MTFNGTCAQVRAVMTIKQPHYVCEECIEIGGHWVHLSRADSSETPRRYAMDALLYQAPETARGYLQAKVNALDPQENRRGLWPIIWLRRLARRPSMRSLLPRRCLSPRPMSCSRVR
jgi:hypothetical protein